MGTLGLVARPRPWGIRVFSDPKFVAAGSVLVAALVVLSFLHSLIGPLPLLDLNAHLDGARQWQQGLDPYRQYLGHAPGEIGGGYVFPPYTLPFFLALDQLPREAVNSLWAAAELAGLAWLVWDLAAPRTATRLAAITVLAVTFFPLLTNVALGQVGIPVLAGLWAAGRLAGNTKQGTAGLLFGLASLVKLFPLVLAAGLMLRHRWRTIGLGLLVIVGAIAVTWPMVANLWPEYVGGVLTGHLGAPNPSPGNQSIEAAVVRALTVNPYQRPILVVPSLARMLSLLLPLLLVALVMRRLLRLPDDRVQDAVLLALLPLVLPNAWQHYYVFALPLLWIVLSEAVSRRDPRLLAAGSVAVITLSWIAGTVDQAYFAVARVAPAWHGLYANASLLGGLILLLTAIWCLRSPQLQGSGPLLGSIRAAGNSL